MNQFSFIIKEKDWNFSSIYGMQNYITRITLNVKL